MFAIICNARKGQTEGISTLVLVDRSKSRKLWWTSDTPGLMQSYATSEEAQTKANTLTQNNARVVPAATATDILQRQRQAVKMIRDTREKKREERGGREEDADLGWDAHKGGY